MDLSVQCTPIAYESASGAGLSAEVRARIGLLEVSEYGFAD